MRNIKIMGKFTSDTDLIQGKSLPANAVMFEEGETFQDVFKKGFLLILPIMAVVIGSSIYRCKQMHIKPEITLQNYLLFMTGLVLIAGLTYVHEFIHALLYPAQAEKTIWKYPEQGAYFVYCDAVVSRTRFVVMSLAPMIVLGVIPFVFWMIFAKANSFSLMLLFVSWMMILMSLGDLANVYHALTQVPKGHKIMNYGIHSYWLQ